MAKSQIKSNSLADMKDKYIGKPDTTDRDQYEYELRMDILGKMIKTARQERHSTQLPLEDLPLQYNNPFEPAENPDKWSANQ